MAGGAADGRDRRTEGDAAISRGRVRGGALLDAALDSERSQAGAGGRRTEDQPEEVQPERLEEVGAGARPRRDGGKGIAERVPDTGGRIEATADDMAAPEVGVREEHQGVNARDTGQGSSAKWGGAKQVIMDPLLPVIDLAKIGNNDPTIL